MSYTVTANNQVITVYAGTVDTTTSLGLVGKNVSNYGQVIAQNFVYLLENFAGLSSPLNPILGQLWYDAAAHQIKYYNGELFKSISGVTSQNSPPAYPNIGDMWYNNTEHTLSVYTADLTVSATGWLKIGPAFPPEAGKSGPYVEFVADDTSVQHRLLIEYLAGIPIAAFSKDANFNLAQPLNGYTTIKTGINSLFGDINNINGSMTSQIADIRNELLDMNTAIQSEFVTTYAPLDSPVFIGTPNAPSPPDGDHTLRLATTEFVANTMGALGTATNATLALKANIASPHLTGTPFAPTPAVSTNTPQLATTEFVHDVVPRGAIIMWYGTVTQIPTGWSLCDGTNSTPDLRGRFIIGAGSSYLPGDQGGSATVNLTTTPGGAHDHTGQTGSTTLNAAQMPAHSHLFDDVWMIEADSAGNPVTGNRNLDGSTAPPARNALGETADADYGAYVTGGAFDNAGKGNTVKPVNDNAYEGGENDNVLWTIRNKTADAGTGSGHRHVITSAPDHTHTLAGNALPPYYALCYIMKTV